MVGLYSFSRLVDVEFYFIFTMPLCLHNIYNFKSNVSTKHTQNQKQHIIAFILPN